MDGKIGLLGATSVRLWTESVECGGSTQRDTPS